jgi:hypothetical protein
MIFSFMPSDETEISEIHAFPVTMAESVKNAVPSLARGQMHTPTDTVVSVRVAEELLNIPYRVYYDRQRLLKATNSLGETGFISLCLGTRHYDGFIRELCLRRLLSVDEKCAVPFIVQLLGEYVIEVIQPINERFDEGVEAKYIEFFSQNSVYCQYLEQRAISYWNEYYRYRFPKHKDYPAVKALAALKKSAASIDSKKI